MITVATYNKPEEAYLAASVLEGNEIESVVRDAETVAMYWLYCNAIGGVKLDVHEQDYELASEILNLQNYEAESTLLKCPHCGSSNTKIRELSLTAAIGLFLGVILPAPTRKVDCYHCRASFSYDQGYDD